MTKSRGNYYSVPKGNKCGSKSSKERKHWFCNSAIDWGYCCFVLLSELNDSENGFILNDNITVEVEKTN
ncbi:putative ubiquitinyl hydrolase 1 [Helianthus annuus]|nr:putative ubiquitinyl hydrolase 1 [Helianthus annuus]KAJ0684576.1 putative ubiquitinyl hydrolase 1 [Helianthus annuus]KAJ0733748.1 putative ubiquitinyl hydrolase 1 [Helianthus annuus]KAJ0874196.1 putative ubiquitinyl hydrolase 1 [Helianthus annuus]